MILLHDLAIQRTRPLEFLPVCNRARGQREAQPNVLLVLGMDVDGVANVDGDGHAGVAERERFPLGIANFGPTAVRFGIPVRNLNEEEREVALAPGPAPVFDHGWKKMSVERRPLAAIGLALIPDDAANGEGGERSYHPVEKRGRSPRCEIRMPLRPRHRFAFGLRSE